MNDYEAHLSSYDHSHRQRMKDMKQMVKDPTAGARARKAEAKADGLISIKLGDVGGGGGGANTTATTTTTTTTTTTGSAAASGGGFKKGGFKKSGFKSAFAPVGGGGAADEDVRDDKLSNRETDGVETRKPVLIDENMESDTDDEGYELYDPRRPTD